MGGDVETIKERLDIVEIVGGHVKLEKSGRSYKGRCPFHNEKTPSFFVSPERGSYYCFGCGAKGDIFTFVQEVEGLSFREALKDLADRAGVVLKNSAESRESKTEKDRLREALEEATCFFEAKLQENPEAQKYLLSRGLSEETIKEWRVGYAPAEWRSLYHFMLAHGFKPETLIKAGLAKPVADGVKEPYDVFRDRLVFPLSDSNGEVVAFSGRALGKEVIPKYLNTPETVLFAKHELLYGLDKAKSEIRKKNYTVLVEGQMDLVLSHQAGVKNTVASSGTAFTSAHLERLKKLSSRILLAFDGDNAGEKAAEKSSELAMALGLEVKVASLPKDSDPADVIKKNPQQWKEILRESTSAVEFFLAKLIEREKDHRKLGKLIEGKILPLLALLTSSIERSHFVSLIAKRTGIKEEMIWDDLRRTKRPELRGETILKEEKKVLEVRSRREKMEERLAEVRTWLNELPANSGDVKELKREEGELVNNLTKESLKQELSELGVALARAEAEKDETQVKDLSQRIHQMHKDLLALEK